MTEKTKESQKMNINVGGFVTANTPEAIYDYAELKYGPGFAQYCLDLLMREQESPKAEIPKNQHMNALVRLTSHLHALSQVCSADFFHAWGAEDKVFYMTLLADVSNDLSQALHGSLKEIKASND